MPSDPAIETSGLGKVYRPGIRPFETVTPLWRRRAPGDRDRDVDVDDELDEEIDEEAEEPEVPAGAREVVALSDVTLELAAGSRVALIGPPSAGKTTLLKILARITPPSSGRAVVRGRVAPLLELATSFLTPDLSGVRNAIMLGRLLGVPRDVVERNLGDIFAFAGLTGRERHAAGTYSGRLYRRLGLSIALHVEPEVVLAEEHVITGDPEFADRCAARLHAMADAGATLLFAANEPETVAAYCDQVVWMEAGRVAGRGPLPGALSAPKLPAVSLDAAPEPGAAGLMALDPSQRKLAVALAAGRGTYESLAQDRGIAVAEARAEAVAAFEAMQPDGGRLDAATRVAVVDHLLGRPNASAVAAYTHGVARNWGRMLHYHLAAVDRSGLAEVPRLPPDGAGAAEPAPPVEPEAAALLEFIEGAFGELAAREALTVATDKAEWKAQNRVRWADVAEAAELSHEVAKLAVPHLRRLRSAGSTRVRPVSAEEPASDFGATLLSATVRDARGEEAELLNVEEDAVVEAVVETSTSRVTLSLHVVLEAADAPPLRLSQPSEFVAERPGCYRLSARLPGRTLHDAHYTARVTASTTIDGREQRIAWPRELSFEAYGQRESGADDDGGAHRDPQVAWEVTG